MTDQHDQRLREMTFKLMNMAPKAPPFPETPVTTLKPQKTPEVQGIPPRTRTWSGLAVAAAAFGLALLIALPVVLLNRGDTPPANPTTTVPPTTTLIPTPPVATDVTLYFLADYVEDSNVPGPLLVAVHREVEVVSTDSPPQSAFNAMAAAIVELLSGPGDSDAALVPGISTSIPAGTELLGYTVDNTRAQGPGRATLDLSADFEAGGGSFSMMGRLAQLVYTATQFAEIDEVEFQIEGEPVAVFSAEGIVLDGPQTRDDYTGILPLILVESPLPGAVVSSPITIAGISNTFEANLQYRLETRGGSVIASGFTTATCGTGCWGDYAVAFDYGLAERTDGYVVVFESSAEDGRPVNVVRVPVVIEAAEGATGSPTAVFAELPGGAPLDGSTVVASPLMITGRAEGATEISVDGATVPVTDDFFEANVVLTPGRNEIVVGDGVTATVFEVTYVPGGTVEFAFLRRVAADEIAADYAQWLTGEEANRAAVEDGEIAAGESLPNDYYIRNQNPQLRTLPVASDFAVMLPTPAFGSVEVTAVTPAEWLAMFQPDGSPWNAGACDQPDGPVCAEPHFGYFGAGEVGFGYWLTLDADGTVLQVVGQYRP